MKVWHYKYIVMILAFSILTTFSYLASKTMFLNLEKGKVSDRIILSPQTFTYVDKDATQKQKELTLSQVQDIYEKDPKIQENQSEDLKDFFESVLEQKKLYQDALVQNENHATIQEDAFLNAIANPYSFDKAELKVFFESDALDLNRMKEVFGKELENFYASGVTEDKFDAQKEAFMNNAIFYHYDETLRSLLLTKIADRLEPNLLLNKEETNAKRKEALDSVKPVTVTVQRGERIVGEGEMITPAVYTVLKNAGLISDGFDIKKTLNRFPFILLIFTCLHFFLYKFNNREIQNKRLYIFTFVVAFASTLLVNLLQMEYFTYTMLVVALITMTTFLNASLSIMYAIVLGMLFHPGDYGFLTMAIVLGVVQTLGHNPKGDRNTILNFGLVMAVALVITKLVLQLILGLPIDAVDFISLIIGPILASWLVLGLFGYLERMLGVVTSLKLHELTSPHHKLYQRLNNEAPGTLQHSLRVGNLAEAAADGIGANGLLLKVGATYHDAGKLENPTYFIENLVDASIPNPHDFLTPKQSAAFIKQHPIDSVRICRKYGIPEDIISLVEKHHGDDLVRYFYYKELETNPEANPDDFKYQTPLPVTREEGILMLADITEASSRSIMYEETKIFKEKLTDIIYQKIEDGQFRKCELTLKEINIIIDIFIKQLIPANHKRPKYPNQK